MSPKISAEKCETVERENESRKTEVEKEWIRVEYEEPQIYG